jgi:hypothetical protein
MVDLSQVLGALLNAVIALCHGSGSLPPLTG